MGLSTKDIKIGSLSKTILPGEHVLKLHSLELQHFDWMNPGAYNLVHHVETEPIPDFEGFLIDKDDESKGRYLGQVGQVKSSQWYYEDKVLEKATIVRDVELLRQLKLVCIALGEEAEEWLLSIDGVYDTIEEIFEGFNAANLTEGKLLRYCVAGKEYERTGENQGFVGIDLYIPKPEKGKVGFERHDVIKSSLIQFNEDLHWKKLEIPGLSMKRDQDADLIDGLSNEQSDEAPDFELPD